MATFGSVGATGDDEIDGVLAGSRWIGTLTYSFPNSSLDYPFDYPWGTPFAYGFAQISPTQQAVVHRTMALVGQYTNLTIQYAGTDGADIRIAQSSEAAPTAYAYYPDANEGGDVWFGIDYNYRNPRLGSYEYATHIHEIGHALGLKHSHELEGPANVAVPYAHDALEYTVMSYRSFIGGPVDGGYTNEDYGFPTTFMMNDIRALQEMYGANFNTYSGNTVYRWSPATGETFINGVGQGRPGGAGAPAAANVLFMTVWDGGGIDTYDFSNYTNGMAINLNPGAYSVTSGAQRANLDYYGIWPGAQVAHGNVYNAYLFDGDVRSYIENAYGGSGSDSIFGNAVANMLDGRAGNDVLYGNLGNDMLTGGVGRDTVIGGDGNDWLYGAAHADSIYGGADDDTFVVFGVDSLSDLINGGTGTDTIVSVGTANVVLSRFDAATSSIEVWDGNGGVILGTARADVLDFSALESFTGVAYIHGLAGNDRIACGDGSQSLVGGLGHDALFGGGGNDWLTAGAGSDFLVGGAGDDYMHGGAGRDYFSFTPGFGNDTIADFAWGPGAGDVIVMDADIFANLDAVLAASTQVGGSVVITASMSDTLTLHSTFIGNLYANDFMFV